MGQIIKFPALAAKRGYKRARRRAQAVEDRSQLELFPQPTAQILDFVPDLRPFEQALWFDERGDTRAVEFYGKAIEAEDRVADAWCNLGILESQRGNSIKAFDCFTTSLKHDPRHFEAHYNLGNLYFDLNDLRLAHVHYEMARDVDPSFANVYFNLALVEAINNDVGAAINSLIRYQALASKEEASNADELLRNLKRSLATATESRVMA